MELASKELERGNNKAVLDRNRVKICNRTTAPNNSFQPTLASESFIIKFRGFGYAVCIALASGG
jgi:hypothetical protein